MSCIKKTGVRHALFSITRALLQNLVSCVDVYYCLRLQKDSMLTEINTTSDLKRCKENTNGLIYSNIIVFLL